MSIPPLVCSTPPPPEQCEDDKDPEDFDLQYNLSQDDEEGYDYGQFSNPNDFRLPASKYNEDINSLCLEEKNISLNHELSHNCKEKSENLPEDCILHTTIEESINIEDLNLEINDEYIAKNEDHDTSIIDNIESKNEKFNFQNEIPSSNIPNLCNIESSCSESLNSPFDTSPTKESEKVNELTEELPTKFECDEDNEIVNINNKFDDNIIASFPSNTGETESKDQDSEEDFDDFDSFQFSTTITNNEKVVMDTEDPWGNSNSDDFAFSEFKADFGNEKLSENSICYPKEPSSKDDSKIKPEVNSSEIDDEFGDFDEFKCSVTDDNASSSVLESVSEDQPVPVFNLHSDNEHQLMESINKVLQSIFIEEITTPEVEIKSNLETFLGETWAHLKDTDVRRPYMVNWNNSLAQETLLKALCIDSRNILYGPKWSNNMPKYATNMSSGPLIPQKQTMQSSSHQVDQVVMEKSANKTSWQDPFTSDGQEFTYAEALLLDLEHLMATLDLMAHNHSTLKISELLSNACAVEKENAEMESGPTDIDVFEAAITPQSDKIYSTTMNIQPIRQINLPDTHIFTPTDSETPRSKTIHYDNNTNHSILIPQPVQVIKTQEDDFPSGTTTQKSLENDNDYWEFQDFKGSANINITPGHQNAKEITNSPIIKEDNPRQESYKSQVLQPIKLEPIIPTLNWPNPGEVKETFDDFADFISNVPNSNQKIPSSEDSEFLNLSKPLDKELNKVTSESIEVEDDFDKFQSALPLSMNILEANINQSQDTSLPQNMVVYDGFFSKIDPIKSDDISINNTRQIENATESIATSSDVKELNFISAPLTNSITSTNILQPTNIAPHSSQHTEQKTGQILQPLSLEAYSQINWPNPGINLHDLSRFNPVESLSSLKSEMSSHSKNSSPSHLRNLSNDQVADDDIWGEFKSSIPKPQQSTGHKQTTFVDDDEWTDFISSPSVPQNGLNTISYNVHANFNIHKSSNSSKHPIKGNDLPIDIPTLNYITPKTSIQKPYNEQHFQNL